MVDVELEHDDEIELLINIFAFLSFRKGNNCDFRT